MTAAYSKLRNARPAKQVRNSERIKGMEKRLKEADEQGRARDSELGSLKKSVEGYRRLMRAQAATVVELRNLVEQAAAGGFEPGRAWLEAHPDGEAE